MRFLLIEDHPIFRLGVRQVVLQHWPEAEVREAASLAEALALVRNSGVDLVLADLNLPDSTGLEVLTQLRRCRAELRILVLSLNAEAAYAQRALQMGAAGYLAKDRACDELIAAMQRILAGGRYITASLAEQLADLLSGQRPANLHSDLSAQEYRVMIQLAQGKRISAIAQMMHLSPKTISTYRSRILEKLDADSNAALAHYCLTHNLLE